MGTMLILFGFLILGQFLSVVYNILVAISTSKNGISGITYIFVPCVCLLSLISLILSYSDTFGFALICGIVSSSPIFHFEIKSTDNGYENNYRLPKLDQIYLIKKWYAISLHDLMKWSKN